MHSTFFPSFISSLSSRPYFQEPCLPFRVTRKVFPRATARAFFFFSFLYLSNDKTTRRSSIIFIVGLHETSVT